MKYLTVKASTLLTTSMLAVASITLPAGVLAQSTELVIEDNGAGSSQEVNVTSQTQTNVTQTNQMDVANNVNAGATTGGNQANGNTGGDVGIVTGDAAVNVNIINSGNTSQVALGCCVESNGSIVLSGNGAYSNNSVNAYFHNGLNVSVYNNADVTNSVYGKAITGKNEANYNLGDVFINTGSIYARESITNGLFNVVNVSAGVQNMDFSIKIKDNGAYSENNFVLDQTTENNISVENNFIVANETDWELVTGQNSANKNLGDVLIATGDIYYDSVITNKGNVASVEISCCPLPPSAPVTPVTPPSPPTVSNGPSGGGVSGPTSAAGGLGGGHGDGILPVTGANFLFLFLLLNTLFLLFGAFLKLRAGRSPAFAYAI